jgi:acyl-CoA thioester hydrolase
LARIKIKPQGIEVFKIESRFRVQDMNYGNHLGNDKVLSIFHDTRLAWMKSIDQAELQFFGKALIQHDSVVNYKSEAFFDEKYRVILYIDDIDTRSFDFYYQLESLNTGKAIALGKTGMTFYDYDLKQITETPPHFREKFKS